MLHALIIKIYFMVKCLRAGTLYHRPGAMLHLAAWVRAKKIESQGQLSNSLMSWSLLSLLGDQQTKVQMRK
jgi:hypothetical protein